MSLYSIISSNMSNSGQNWKQRGIFYRVFYEEPVSSGPTCQLSRLELIYFDDAFYYAKKWAFEKYVHCTVKIIANHGVKISSEGGFKKYQCPLEPRQNTIFPVLQACLHDSKYLSFGTAPNIWQTQRAEKLATGGGHICKHFLNNPS